MPDVVVETTRINGIPCVVASIRANGENRAPAAVRIRNKSVETRRTTRKRELPAALRLQANQRKSCLTAFAAGVNRSYPPMKLLDALVEQRINEAASRGAFNDLPGAGKPLEFDDDLLVPEEVRVANRILKNAGFVPPAVEQLLALRGLQEELDRVTDPATRCQIQVKMLALDMALESLRGGGCVPHEYRRRIAERLSERAQSRGGPELSQP
jgi:hypothetical protein